MDSIFKGVLNSDYPWNMKRCFIEKKLIPASESPLPPEDSQRVFKACWEVLTSSDSAFDKEMALKMWKSWAANKPAVFEEFVKNLQQLPNDSPIQNKLGCLEAACYGMETCPAGQQKLAMVAESLAEELIETEDATLEDVVTLLESLRKANAPLTRPSHLACLLVQRLASSPYRNFQDSISFYQNATAIAEFLKELLQSYPGCVAETVGKVCQLLADPSATSFYSTLAPVIEILDMRHCQSVLGAIQSSSIALAGPTQLVLALARLFTMLFWPYAGRNLPQWIALALRALGPPRWCPIIHNLLNSKLVEVFDMILIQASSHAAVQVFCDILLSYQPAHEHFEQVVEKLGPVSERLQEDHPTNWNLLASAFLLFLKVNKDFSLIYGRRCYPLLVTEAGQDLVQQLESQYLCRGQRLAAAYQERQPSAGLNNVGNTCYLNSILQALFATPSFRNYVLSSTPTSEQPVLRDLRELFAFLFLSKRPSVDPDQYMTTLQLGNFFKGQQQDCQEYLQHLLNKLPQNEVFGVTTQTNLVCQHCQMRTAHKQEKNLDLLLHFPRTDDDAAAGDPQTSGDGAVASQEASSSEQPQKEDSTKLEDLLRAVQEGELIEDYLCENCKKEEGRALCQTNVVDLPRHLILTVLRHSHLKQCPTKILRHIEFPETLQFSSTQDNHAYSLYAFVVHQGPNMHCGHYFTYARSPWNWGRWYLFDDSSVSKVEFVEISGNDNTRQNIYQLFYRKVEEGQEDDDSAAQETYEALETLDLPLKQKISDDNEAFVKSLDGGANTKAASAATTKPAGPPARGCGEGLGPSDISSSRCIF